MEVFSLVGLMKRSARRSTRDNAAATRMDTPSTTTTGEMVSQQGEALAVDEFCLALPKVSA